MPLDCDDFVFRKVNWLLLLRRGDWVGFRLVAKFALSMMKPNCQSSLSVNPKSISRAYVSLEDDGSSSRSSSSSSSSNLVHRAIFSL